MRLEERFPYGERIRTMVEELVLERLLDDRDIDDDTLGFQAKQAAEKLRKAALVARKADYSRTHNLGVLIELLSDAGVKLSANLADIDRFTPFGTVFRYDEVLPQGGQDRSRWLAWIRGLRAFVEAAMD
jgi:hypothetical protein